MFIFKNNFLKNLLIKFKNIVFILDLILIPIMLIARFCGFRVYEAKTKSFGHSVEEPYVLSILYKENKRKYLLFNSKKSYNKSTYILFNKIFKIIEFYSFFSPWYWMARSPVVGVSRQFLLLNDLKFINKTKYKFYKNSIDLNWEYFVNNQNLEDQFRSINPLNKKYILWKPRTTNNRNHLRDSSVKSMKKLFNYLIDSGYLIFSLSKDHPENMSSSYIPLYSIFSNQELDKLNFKLDYHASYFVVGDTGGWVSPYVLNKPLIVYDVGLPCSLYKGVKKCLIITKIFKSKTNGKYMSLEEMLSYRFDKITNKKDQDLVFNKIHEKYKVINNSEDDLLKSFLELEEKCKIYKDYFPVKSYKINRELGGAIPRGITNINGPVQLADYFTDEYPEIFVSNKLTKFKT